MRRTTALLLLALFLLFTAGGAVFAQRGGVSQGGTIEVRLASPMPRNSDWGRTMDRMAAEWARVTNNQVRLRIIHDGIEGGESKVLSSLATDNIQATLFTSFGVAQICPAVMTLSIPFLIANDDELDRVLQNVQPILDDQISKTNFVVIAWSKGGWVHVFSKDPVIVPEDLRKHRVATNPESVDMNTVFKTMGFNMVETDMTDLGPRLASNMINSIYQTPAAVAPLGIHKSLGHMMDMPIAPFLGAIVMNRVTWNKLGPDRQRDITRVTQRIAAEFDTSMPKTTASAVSMMARDGLKINKISSAQEAVWRSDLLKAMPQLLGTTFDRDVYQKINEILEKMRGGQ